MLVVVATIIVNRVDQILIGNMLGQVQVGIYAAARRITELLTFFPSVICTSLFPAIINAKNHDSSLYFMRLKRLNIFLSWGSILISLICMMFSSQIVLVLYGLKYVDSARCFSLLSLNLIFISMSMLSSKWYIVEGLQKLLLVKYLLMLAVNAVLNYVLISKVGIVGSAYSSLFSTFFFYFIFDLFWKETRPLFLINTSFLWDWRILKKN